MQYSQEHLKTMVYAKFGGQTECIMGNSKIENALFFFTLKSISKIACTQALFYFSFRSYPLALAVSKSPAVYILSPALD